MSSSLVYYQTGSTVAAAALEPAQTAFYRDLLVRHRFRDAWRAAGHGWEPRVSVSRSIFQIVSDQDRAYFLRETRSQDQVGFLDGGPARFGKTYAAEPEALVTELAKDEAIAAADTLLLTVPNQLGVEYNAHVIEGVLEVARELGWR